MIAPATRLGGTSDSAPFRAAKAWVPLFSPVVVVVTLVSRTARLGFLRTPASRAKADTDAASSDFHPLESSPAARTGNLAVAPPDDLEGLTRPQQPGTVNRGAYESAISGSVAFPAAGVLNVASFAGGAVSPGELVTIFGTGFGASPIAQASYGSDGYLPVEVGATRVYFDNVAAPMIYSLNRQVSAVAPYDISGATQVQVEYAGLRSQAVSIPVTTAAPGIYCYAGGAGQAVAINTYADQSVAYNQARPATPGSYLTFFITGEGATASPWADGLLPVPPLFPTPAAPVIVRMGGVLSECPETGRD